MDQFSDAIQDSLCVGQSIHGSDEQVVLFVQMQKGIAFDQEIEIALRNNIAASLSKRHVPKKIYQIPKVPYNVNGKKLEIAVKKVISGGKIDPKLRTTLVHPDDLDVFRQYSTTSVLKASL